MTTDAKRKWCAMLAKLVAPMDAERAARAFVDMLPMLPAEDDRYTRSALERAAKIDRKTAVPTFDDLSRAFAEDWHENLPVTQRLGGSSVRSLPSPTPKPPSAEECEAVARSLSAFKAHAAQVSQAKGVGGRLHDTAPAHLDKLQLARSAPPEVLATRPDLRAVLRDAEAA